MIAAALLVALLGVLSDRLRDMVPMSVQRDALQVSDPMGLSMPPAADDQCRTPADLARNVGPSTD